MQPQYYRPPWTKERVDFLIQWWPHFASAYLADQLGLTLQQVKSKVNKLGLHLLPRGDRLCVRCQTNYQYTARRTLLCHACLLIHRKELRQAAAAKRAPVDNAAAPHPRAHKLAAPPPKVRLRPAQPPRQARAQASRSPKARQDSENQELRALKRWITTIVRNAQARSVTPADITVEYMLDLWQQQEGRCFYTGRVLHVPRRGDGRNLFAPSIDRLDPSRGYVKGNVVWATLACNLGKGILAVDDYVRLCADVSRHRLPPGLRGLLVCGNECLGLNGA